MKFESNFIGKLDRLSEHQLKSRRRTSRQSFGIRDPDSRK